MQKRRAEELAATVCAYIRERRLLRAGDRVCVAVSGGADSVGLLRLLLEVRGELGIVLSVAHFHHGIRGTEADADERFVAELAGGHDLEFHRASGDAPGLAKRENLSLETAARRLRYAYFQQLVSSGACDKVATGHTLDDQAETVLMKALRGAGSRGLAGIAPVHGAMVRPLLGVRRNELREYLATVGQPWREDASNLDLKHTRNRVRQELLPLLEDRYNPAVAANLAATAEIAAADEEYFEALITNLAGVHIEAGGDEVVLRQLELLPLALQRRLIRAAATKMRLSLDFEHVEGVLRVLYGRTRAHELPRGWRVSRAGGGVRLALAGPGPKAYGYTLPVPGEIKVAETGSRLRATLLNAQQQQGYNPAELLDPAQVGTELMVRNWAPGDRFWPAHSRAAKKVKELLQERKVPPAERSLWPVVVRGQRVLWMRGFAGAADALVSGAASAVVIEEL